MSKTVSWAVALILVLAAGCSFWTSIGAASLDEVDFALTVIVWGKSESESISSDVGELMMAVEFVHDYKVSFAIESDWTAGKERPTAVIVVGKEAASKALGTVPPLVFPDEGLGKEGYVIKSVFNEKEKLHYFFLAGQGLCGTRFALLEFARLIRLSCGGKKIPLPLAVREVPYFARRGMYGHLHWVYNYPYACRTWSERDWERYVDLLSNMKFNMLQIWTMVGILPHPLSDADRKYLEKYKRVVDHAHKTGRMEAWLGDCANNVAENDKGMPIERREYFEVERLKNPGDPRQFDDIMSSRENLYRTLPGADAYWIIDSDPGGWKGSPASELVDIFVGHRKVMDRFCERPKEQALVYWMWWGWGTKSQKENWRNVVLGLKEKLPEPWLLEACNREHVRLLKELGLTDRAIYFPYGAVEHEPSSPMTVFQEGSIREAVRLAKEERLPGVMGNSQTPVVQLPDIYLLSRLAWNPDDPASFDDMLEDLSMQLDPLNPFALAKGWKALKGNDAREMLAAKDALEVAAEGGAKQKSLLAGLGQHVPAGIEALRTDLRTLLTIKASAVRLGEVAPKGSEEEIRGELFRYLEALLIWTERTGYHRKVLVYGPYRELFMVSWKKVHESLAELNAKANIAEPVYRRLSDRFPKESVKTVTEGLLAEMSPAQ